MTPIVLFQGRITKFYVEWNDLLGTCYIEFEPRKSKKGQAISSFLGDFWVEYLNYQEKDNINLEKEIVFAEHNEVTTVKSALNLSNATLSS